MPWDWGPPAASGRSTALSLANSLGQGYPAPSSHPARSPPLQGPLAGPSKPPELVKFTTATTVGEALKASLSLKEESVQRLQRPPALACRPDSCAPASSPRCSPVGRSDPILPPPRRRWPPTASCRRPSATPAAASTSAWWMWATFWEASSRVRSRAAAAAAPAAAGAKVLLSCAAERLLSLPPQPAGVYPELLEKGFLETHRRLSISELQSGERCCAGVVGCGVLSCMPSIPCPSLNPALSPLPLLQWASTSAPASCPTCCTAATCGSKVGLPCCAWLPVVARWPVPARQCARALLSRPTCPLCCSRESRRRRESSLLSRWHILPPTPALPPSPFSSASLLLLQATPSRTCSRWWRPASACGEALPCLEAAPVLPCLGSALLTGFRVR